MVIKDYYRKIRRKKMLVLNRLRLKFSHSKKTIGLVSCDLWKNRVYDDLLLQRAFLKSGLKAEIISWQDNTISLERYDALLITSMWGYQRDISALESWLKKVSGLKIYNSVDIIKNNYNKISQMKLLEKSGLPIAKTIFCKKSDFQSNNQTLLEAINSDIGGFPLVVKPSISSGGENTFLIEDLNDFKKVSKKFQGNKNESDLLIQSYIPEIHNGEISVIMIDKKIVNAVVRFPGIIDRKKQYRIKRININNLNPRIVRLCKKIAQLEALKNQLYARIDIVEKDNDYIIMEVEMFEPQLFYYLLRGSARREMLQTMVDAVEKRLLK